MIRAYFTIAMVFVVAERFCLAQGGPPATSSQPSAPSIDARRDEIDAQVRQLLRKADIAGPKPLEKMAEDAAKLHALAGRIGQFLKDNPNDSARDRLTLARWEALYFAATLKGESLDGISREIDDLLKGTPSQTLREEAEYWRLRLEVNRIRALQTLGRSDGLEAVVLMQAFVDARPACDHAVSLTKEIIEALYRTGDISGIDACLDLLRKHHPDNVVTKSLLGQHRLRHLYGVLWRPELTGLDGRPFDWQVAGAGGAPMLVIFWSPMHSPSGRMLQFAQSLQQRIGVDKLRIVTIALHKSADAIARELSKLGVAYPTAHEAAAWRSTLVGEFGIRTLPTVLMLDQDGKLKGAFEPRSWDMRSDFEDAASAFLGIPASQPSTSAVLEAGATTQPSSQATR